MKTSELRSVKGYYISIIALGALMFLLTFSFYARGLASNDQPNVSQQDAAVLKQKAQAETELLMRAAANRSSSENALLEIAERRQATMLALMENAPAVTLENAFPTELRNQLPAEVRSHIEEQVSVNGTLEVLCVLEENGQARTEYYLEVGDKRFQLFVDQMPSEYLTGARLNVTGLLLANHLAADPVAITAEYVPSVDGGEPNVVSRRALVINVNFSDLPTQPWTVATAQNVFQNQDRSWFTEVSFGEFDFQADVTPWYTIAASSTSCNTTAFRQQGEAAATAAGYVLSQYNHVVIAFPRVAACSWAGLGQVPGRYTWLNQAMNLNVSVHELGHNLGLSHSRSQRCTTGPLSGSCTTTEYGDRYDLMGSGTNIPFHGGYKAFLGWIPTSDVLNITSATPARLVTIGSVESASGPRVLRVLRPGTTNQYFTIETREPIGFATPLGSFPALGQGVAVYTGGLNSQTIVDMTYQTTAITDAPLLAGQTFSDPNGNLRITPLAVGGGAAVISINYNVGGACGAGTYNGALSGAGDLSFQPTPDLYYYGEVAGTHTGVLSGPVDADFNLYLWYWDGQQWVVVASSEGGTSSETASYTGTEGWYSWMVSSRSGSGSYSLCLTRP